MFGSSASRAGSVQEKLNGTRCPPISKVGGDLGQRIFVNVPKCVETRMEVTTIVIAIRVLYNKIAKELKKSPKMTPSTVM